MKDPEVLEQEYRSAYLGEGGLYHPCDANTFYRLVDFLVNIVMDYLMVKYNL